MDGIDRSRRTPLVHASLGCHESVATWLVGERANPNMLDAHDQTPLDVAEELREIDDQDEEEA